MYPVHRVAFKFLKRLALFPLFNYMLRVIQVTIPTVFHDKLCKGHAKPYPLIPTH